MDVSFIVCNLPFNFQAVNFIVSHLLRLENRKVIDPYSVTIKQTNMEDNFN